MNRTNISRVPAVLLWASLAVMGACAPKVPPNHAPGDPEPPPRTSPEPTNSSASRIDPEDPQAGTNTRRPDSIKDVKPGADGNSAPQRL